MKEIISVELEDSNGIYLTYKLTHEKNGFRNSYTLSAQICGIDGLHTDALYISPKDVINVVGHNEETLMDGFALELLYDYLNR